MDRLHQPALKAHEHRERAERAAHEQDSFISRVSITIAVLAVLAAVVGSLETIEAAGAITASGEAMLAQNKASDAWAEYQADGLKGDLYTLFGEAGGADGARYRRAAAEQRMRQDQMKPKALEGERERDGLLTTGRRHERQHHGLARSATLLEHFSISLHHIQRRRSSSRIPLV